MLANLPLPTACLLVTLLTLTAPPCRAQTLDQSGTLWGPVLEWTLHNPQVEGNPYDVVAHATFTHADSGQRRRTGMFYVGEGQWKFRFTGTRTGRWTFQSTSDSPQLDGKEGVVEIAPAAGPDARGYIVAHQAKFARQVGERGELEGLVPNVYMNYRKYGDPSDCGWTDVSRTFGDADVLRAYLDEAEAHGCNAIQALIGNQWFQADAVSAEDHDSENPDPRTFQAIEQAIVAAHRRGMHLHIWAWGDEARHWTPARVGGINGEADLRLQRYLAARLGPLPGWTMSYGFDLFEWVTPEQVSRWHEHLNQEMGWQHLLGARAERRFEPPATLDILAHDLRIEDHFYQSAMDLREQADGRPVLLERRFAYLRDGVWDMETTRRAFWQFTLAGGVGAIWGHYPPDCSAFVAGNYPHPEQLRTHRRFWQRRFRVDMQPARDVSGDRETFVFSSGDRHAVFYGEATESMRLDLSGLAGPQPVVAVDTKQEYAEIDLGAFEPGERIWQAPYASDWAVAVGEF